MASIVQGKMNLNAARRSDGSQEFSPRCAGALTGKEQPRIVGKSSYANSLGDIEYVP